MSASGSDAGRPAVCVRAMLRADAAAVLGIYAEGIATGHATFQAEVPGWDSWDTAHRRDCRLVAQVGTELLGWAALAQVSARPVYRGVCEVSVYVAARARGAGLGDGLLGRLVQVSEAAGVWTLRAGIFPDNEASLALHRRHGFSLTGVHRRVGRMGHGPLAGCWRDVCLMERRSERVGVD